MLVTYNEHLLSLSCSLLFLCFDCGLICFVVYGCGVLVGLDVCFVVLVVCVVVFVVVFVVIISL